MNESQSSTSEVTSVPLSQVNIKEGTYLDHILGDLRELQDDTDSLYNQLKTLQLQRTKLQLDSDNNDLPST